MIERYLGLGLEDVLVAKILGVALNSALSTHTADRESWADQ